MDIIKTKLDLNQVINNHKKNGSKIGFVPTMGALHAGHISLIEAAKKQCDIVVCSIFVNPTQFNDPSDLLKYPRPLEQDIQLLEHVNCSILFLPEVSEMYPDEEIWNFNLGHLEQIFEGAMRPGHFQGVTQIVFKLFDAVKPDFAFFGQKDLQQCKVIEHMIRVMELPIKLIISPIIREFEGLAMSSRNIRLTNVGRKDALALYHTLKESKANFEEGMDLKKIENKALDTLRKSEGIELEYFAIVDSFDLRPIAEREENKQYVALVAAWVEGVRLIDNLFLN